MTYSIWKIDNHIGTWKINKISSENESDYLIFKTAKDSEETSLKPPKVTSLSSETSLAKIHDKNEGSIENESLT